MTKTEAYMLAAAVMAMAGWHVDSVDKRGQQWVVVANCAGSVVTFRWPEEWVNLIWRERANLG